MTSADRIVLDVAASHHAIRRTPRGFEPTRPKFGKSRLNGLTIIIRASVVESIVGDGMLAWVNDCRSAAIITDAGRAALGRVA